MTTRPLPPDLTPKQRELEESLRGYEADDYSALTHEELWECREGLNYAEPAVVGTPDQQVRADALYARWFALMRVMPEHAHVHIDPRIEAPDQS